jgi:predicted RNase H-like nuclease (RuvC/YqgF family)
MVAAGIAARDGETVVSDVGAGEGYADFFAESLRAEDEALDAIEQAARSSSSRAESLYSTLQLQAAGLEEENEALAEKIAEMEREQHTFYSSLQEITDTCLGLERETAQLRDSNRGLQELNHALEHDMRRENDDLKAAIALLQATSKAQRQELEMERTKMNQKLQQEKRDALEEVQLSKSQVEIQKSASKSKG